MMRSYLPLVHCATFAWTSLGLLRIHSIPFRGAHGFAFVHHRPSLSLTRIAPRWASISSETTASSTEAMSSVDAVPSDPYHLPPVSSRTKRIFWVRHGEVINPGAAANRTVYYGSQDVPLSSFGQQEAIVAAEYLAQFPVAAVFSSPLSRAKYGAEQVCRLVNKKHTNKAADDPESSTNSQLLTVRQLDGFRELDRGEWAGLILAEIGADTLAKFDAGDESVTPVGGESYHTLRRRVREARQTVWNDLAWGQIAVAVSHLQVTRCVLADALGIVETGPMAKLKIATASITCIDYTLSCDAQQIDAEAAPLTPEVLFQSFKPDVGLRSSNDGAN
jgi:broad specificity phosphatase PhoE